jgi:hypothetical protein
MTTFSKCISNEKKDDPEKILLVFLPFWTPYLPPQGITTLKAFLKKHGYNVKTADPNMDVTFRMKDEGDFIL